MASVSAEYVVWGIAPGETDERPLFTKIGDKPITNSRDAEAAAAIARHWRATAVRIQRIELGELADPNVMRAVIDGLHRDVCGGAGAQ